MNLLRNAVIITLLFSFPVFAQEDPVDDIIRSEATTNSTVTTNGDMTTRLKSPPDRDWETQERKIAM